MRWAVTGMNHNERTHLVAAVAVIERSMREVRRFSGRRRPNGFQESLPQVQKRVGGFEAQEHGLMVCFAHLHFVLHKRYRVCRRTNGLHGLE